MSEFIIIPTLIVAGFIRGYTGFGFSALVILVLSSMYPVAEMVPAVLLLDLLVCLPLVASAWNKTDFKTLTPLLWATGLGVPFGYLLLLYLPDSQLKVIVPGAITGLAALSHSKHALTLPAITVTVVVWVYVRLDRHSRCVRRGRTRCDLHALWQDAH
ncbi:TSUP family transporter [Vibrio sp. M60_M31a]